MMKNYREILTEKSYLKEISEIDNTEFGVVFKMRNSYEIPLIITFNSFFPSQLPTVMIDTEHHGVPEIPHITKKGLICYLDTEGVIWSDVPNRTLDFVFERVERVLISNFSNKEFHREFSYYYGSLEYIESTLSIYQPADYPEEISIYTIKDHPFSFLKNEFESRSFLNNLLGININSRMLHKAFYIPLDFTYRGNVPQLDSFWSNKEITQLVTEHLSLENLKEIKKFSTNKSNYYYLIRIPLLEGEETLIGLWFRKIDSSLSKKVIPIIDESIAENFEVTPLFIVRNDDATLLERGGGIKENAKILHIGCGSVGSDLLFLLARSGLKNFTLVDNDELKTENSYRHFLGMDKGVTRKPKVELLKNELESRYPNIKIEGIFENILESIRKKDIILDNYDLILVNTGDANLERRLNKIIYGSNTTGIFTWVEAYGIGGHSLMVNNHEKGCYECLVTKNLRLFSSLAGESNLPFIKNIDGCATSFTPYGGVDSMETALLTSRFVLRYLKEGVFGNPLKSWKGSANELLSNGFVTSSRYNETYDYLCSDTYEYINESCKVCGSNKAKVEYYG